MIFQEEDEGQVFLCPSLHESESSVSYFLDARRVSLRDRACSLYPHSALAQLHWAPAARRLRDTLCSYSASWYPASFLVFQSHSIFEKKKKFIYLWQSWPVQLYSKMKADFWYTNLIYVMKWRSWISRSATVQHFHTKQLVFSFQCPDSICFLY